MLYNSAPDIRLKCSRLEPVGDQKDNGKHYVDLYLDFRMPEHETLSPSPHFVYGATEK